MSGTNRTFHAKIECGSVVIDSGFLSIIKYSQAQAGTDTISFGEAISTYVTINMYRPVDFSFTGKTFTLYFGLEYEGYIEYVQAGIYTAQKPETDGETITFSAYDAMTTTLGKPYFSSLEGKTPIYGSKDKVADLKEVIQEILDLTGISFPDLKSLPDGKMVALKRLSINEDETAIELKKTFDGQYKYREALGYIAGCYGKFATINIYGELEFRWYRYAGGLYGKIPISRNCNDLVLGEEKFEVQYVNCATSDKNSVSIGKGSTGINVSNPIMGDLDSLSDQLLGMSYYPLTFSFLGDLRVEIGDMIRVEIKKDTWEYIPVMSITQDYDGGLTSIVGCYGNTEEADVAASSVTSTSGQIDSIRQQLLEVQQVNATTVTTEYLNANYATIQGLTAVTADITDLKTHTVTTDYLEANYAKIDLANIEKATVGTLLADIGLITDAKIENGHVTGYLDSVSINATNIKAGTLSVDRLVINGTDESLIFALNNAGQLTSTHCDTLDGGLLTERTITADHLVAGTITSNEVNTSELFASSGFISALSATSIIVTTKETAENAESMASSASSTASSAWNKADSATSVANTASNKADAAQSAAESAAADAASANSTLSKWVYTGTTKINGGMIQTDTIEAGAIKVTDLTAFGATIGGFNIGSTYIANGTTLLAGAANSVYLGTNGISCGTDFKVTKSGNVTMQNGIILNNLYGKYNSLDNVKVLDLATASTPSYTTFNNGGYMSSTATSNSSVPSLYVGSGAYQNIFKVFSYFKATTYFGSNVSFGSGVYFDSAISFASTVYFAKSVAATSTNGYFVNSSGTARFNKLYVGGTAYFANGTDYYVNSSGSARVSALTCKGDAAVNSLSVTSTSTLSGDMTISNGKDIYAKTPSGKSISAIATSTSSEYLYVGNNSYVTVLRGSTVYLKSTSATVTSDRKEKNSIEDLDERYEDFFLRLLPKRFKYNDGTSGRYHNGFIAQDIYDNLIDAGLTDMDFAGYVNIDKSGELGLMYDDFISINTHMIQKNYLHLSEHDQKIQDLETRLAAAEETIEQLKQAVA